MPTDTTPTTTATPTDDPEAARLRTAWLDAVDAAAEAESRMYCLRECASTLAEEFPADPHARALLAGGLGARVLVAEEEFDRRDVARIRAKRRLARRLKALKP